MHVTHLDDHASPLAAFSAPPFRSEEWRNLGLASCARLADNLGNGIIQQTPGPAPEWASVGGTGPSALPRQNGSGRPPMTVSC